MARETGLEPAASGVTGRRSNQLSYSRVTPPPTTRERGAGEVAPMYCMGLGLSTNLAEKPFRAAA